MKRYILLLLFSLSLFNSYSCCCAFWGSVENDIKVSKLIIKGKVIKKRKIVLSRKFFGNELYKIHGFLNTIEIDKTYKGKKREYIKIISGKGGGDCGFRFKKGKSYIIFSSHKRTYKMKNFFTTSICTSTSIYSKQDEENILKYINK
jgi:hypothetical protein